MAASNRPETEQPAETMAAFLGELCKYEQALREQGFVCPDDLLSLSEKHLGKVAKAVQMNLKLALLRLAAPSTSPASIVFIHAPDLGKRLGTFDEYYSTVTTELQKWTSLQAETNSTGLALKARINQELTTAKMQLEKQAESYHQQVNTSVAAVDSLCQQNIERLEKVVELYAETKERCHEACRSASPFSPVSKIEAEIMSATDELFANTKIPFLEKPAELKITTLRFPGLEFSLSVTLPGVRDQPFDLKVAKQKWTLDFSMNTSHLTFNQELCTVTKRGGNYHSPVLGNQPLEDGVVHSWKVKILTAPNSSQHWYCLGVTQLREPTCSYNDASAISSNDQVYKKHGTSSTSSVGLGKAWLVDDVLSFTLNLIDRTFRIRCERTALEHVFTSMHPGVYYPFFDLYQQGNSLQLLEVNGVSCLSAK